MSRIVNWFLGFCVIWSSVAWSDSISDAQRYVEKAQDYLVRDKVNEANIELKNALLNNPDNAQARMLMGKVQLDVGNAAGAEKELRRASQLGLADGVVLPLLARAFLAQGKLEELQALPLEKLTANDQKATVLAAQGLGKLAQREVDGATEKIDQAVSLDQQSVYVGIAKASLLATKQEYDLSRKELDRILELDPNYAPAWSMLGDLEKQDKNLAKAEAAYTKATENSPNNPSSFLLKRAGVRIQQQKYEEAQKDIDVMKKRAPRHMSVNYMQGLIHFQNNRFPEAKEAFDLTLASNNRHPQALYYQSLTNLRLGNKKLAESYGNQFLTVVPGSVPGRKLMATIELGNRQYRSAEEMIRPVVAHQQDDVEALNLLANLLLIQNKTGEAIELLEKVASLQPDSASAQLRLGASLLASGNQASGIEHIEKAREMDPQLQLAHATLGHFYLKQKDFDKALKAAEIYRDQFPDSAAPYNLIGRILLASGQEKNAVEAFTRAREIAPGDPEANKGLAALAFKKKAYQEARGYYQDVLQHHENHLSTLLSLAVLDAMEKNEQAMLSHLQQAAVAHPKEVYPKVLLARYYLTKGKPEKVSPLMFELSEKKRNIPDVLNVTAVSQLAQKQYPKAKKSLDQLIEQQPDNVQAHFLLAQANAGLKDRHGMKKELETAIELQPSHFAARLAFARLLLLEGQKDQVTEQLAVLNELLPDHPDVLRLKASLEQGQSYQEKTSAQLEDLFEASPSTASMLAIARQKWAMGDQMAAIELQEQWAAEHPDDITAQQALADVYTQQGQVKKAITQYQKILEIQKHNVVALNALAWHLRDEQPAKALEYAVRASVLAPKSAAVMDTLAVVMLKNGDIKGAKRNIEKVLAKKPKKPDFLYHDAMIDAAAGDKASAIKTLQALLGGEGGDFPEKAEAQQLLDQLQAGG